MKIYNTLSKKIEEFIPHTATIYCRPFATLKSSWTKMNYYLWTNDGTQLNGNWPGKEITETAEVNGQTWYKQTVDINTPKTVVNVVFSTGSGSPQTVDVTGITEDAYFVIKNSTNEDGKYEVTDVSTTVGIAPIDNGQLTMANAVYDLSGRRVVQPVKAGVYIRGGKKYLVK